MLVAAVFAVMPQGTNPDDPPPAFMAAFMGCFGLIHVVPGVLQIIAGPRLMRMRGRPLAMVALLSGLATLFGCYCMPTSVCLLVFGMIVLNDPAVKSHLSEAEII